jgi:Cu-processing system permease protein
MDGAAKILKYELHDVLRSRWMIVYGLFFLTITGVLFQFGGSQAKVILSLMNIVFIIIPLVSVIFGTMYLYQSREFIELLLCQPIQRKSIYSGLYVGLAVPLAVCFLAGAGIPFVFYGFQNQNDMLKFVVLMISGIFLTFIFTSLAFLISTRQEDKTRGFGLSLLIWFFFSVVYDGVVLFVMYAFSDYPIEYPVIALSLLNPIDLTRIFLLLRIDVSALLGYTGAVFQNFFGSGAGMAVSLTSLFLWTVVPLLVGLRNFIKKDF